MPYIMVECMGNLLALIMLNVGKSEVKSGQFSLKRLKIMHEGKK